MYLLLTPGKAIMAGLLTGRFTNVISGEDKKINGSGFLKTSRGISETMGQP